MIRQTNIRLLYGAAILLIMVFAWSCKTTEANYRSAYERTVENRRDTISRAPSTEGYQRMIYEGDTIQVYLERVILTEGTGTAGCLKEFNVVVGQFRQLFNAKSLMTRLQAAGFDGCFVAQNAKPFYYVVLSSHEGAAAAIEAANAIGEGFAVKVLPPCPYILRTN